MSLRGTAAAVLSGLASATLFYATLQAQADTTRSARDGVYTDRQADRGGQLYPDQCDRCHGAVLEGDEAPSLVGGEFLADWKGLTLADLFERIRGAMPGDHPGSLTRQQAVDLVAFILRANHFPTGPTELKPDVAILRQVRLGSEVR